MNASCCFQCQKRHVGCHSECEEYAEFKKESDERLAARRAFYTSNIEAIKYGIDGKRKQVRKSHG